MVFKFRFLHGSIAYHIVKVKVICSTTVCVKEHELHLQDNNCLFLIFVTPHGKSQFKTGPPVNKFSCYYGVEL